MSGHTPTPWYHRQAGETGALGQPYDWIGDSPTPGGHRRIIVERNSCEPADYAFIVKAVNSHEALVKALTDARTAIASLPMEALGYASDPGGAQIHWPIRDELLHRIDTALNAEPPVNGGQS